MTTSSILVLGGTAWLGREVAAQAQVAGHSVTCLARGEAGPAADGVTFVTADRGKAGAYDAVRDRDWDLVVDVSWQPGFVRSALAALGEQARHWVYVSSCSVYAEHSQPNADESAALLEALEGNEATREQYGEAKVACERACIDAVGDRLLIARAGLIGGYGDGSDRFGYWPARFDRDFDASVLVPAQSGVITQIINVRDLAAWILSVGLAGNTATVNVSGDHVTLDEVFAPCRPATGHTGEVVAATDDWLTGHRVEMWAGPRSLPLWLAGAADHAGFASRDTSAAAALGLVDSGLDRLVADSLAWEGELDPQRERKAGLSDDEQAELLADLRADNARYQR